MTLISVIIPSYNRAPLLDRCLRSVLACQLDDMEVLVADNASEDATQEILGSFHDERLRFWRNEINLGAEKNILNLLKAAGGEWIFCLTDDDYLLPGALDRLASVLEFNDELGVALSALKVIDQNESFLWTYHFHDRTTEFTPGMEALTKMVWAAHVFSRITVRRRWLDLAGTEHHLASMYPQMYFVGAILKDHPGLYLDDCIVAHTSGNPVYWKYSKDYMVGARIEMINDMLAGTKWKDERKVLLGQVIDEVARHHMPLSWSESKLRWVTHQMALVPHREIVFSRRYWFSLLSFLGQKTGQRVKSFFVRGFQFAWLSRSGR